MAEHSAIEWTDATWNPITGCSVVSPGCTNCYAMRLAGGRLQNHPSRKGLTELTRAGPVWNGEVRFNREWLDQPSRWRRPRRIFVCAHGDLFHESVPDEWIDEVFREMWIADHHVFQVLTKRADRMRSFVEAHGRVRLLSHVWLGVSVEDQPRANERVPELAKTPAAVRYISAEPLIGPVDLTQWLDYLQWVIVGGESGPHARDMDPEWARWILEDCQAHGVAAFMKQMARKVPIPPELLIREMPKDTPNAG